MMSLRILIATHGVPDPRTGVYRSVSGIAACLTGLGHSVDVLTRADVPRLRVRRLDPILLPIAVARRAAAYDLVLFHSYMGWAFHAARRWLDPAGRVATVTAFHGLEPLYQQAVADELARTGERVSLRFRLLHHVIVRRLLAFSCRASDAVLCLNKAEQRYLVEKRWARPDRIAVVRNGFDRALLRPRTHRPRGNCLVFLGQWLRAKGTRYLVEAFMQLAARRDVHLACVGTGAAAEDVLAAFPASVRPLVSVQPSLGQDGILSALHDADVFVFPSLSEGSSMALLEAMAAGLPIVTTRAGAAADVLRDGETALLVPFADTAALVAAIDRLLDDQSMRQLLGNAAQRQAAALQVEDPNAERAACLMRAYEAHTPRTTATEPQHASR